MRRGDVTQPAIPGRLFRLDFPFLRKGESKTNGFLKPASGSCAFPLQPQSLRPVVIGRHQAETRIAAAANGLRATLRRGSSRRPQKGRGAPEGKFRTPRGPDRRAHTEAGRAS